MNTVCTRVEFNLLLLHTSLLLTPHRFFGTICRNMLKVGIYFYANLEDTWLQKEREALSS